MPSIPPTQGHASHSSIDNAQRQSSQVLNVERITSDEARIIYTTPQPSVMRMVAGEQRKAPPFVEREVVVGKDGIFSVSSGIHSSWLPAGEPANTLKIPVVGDEVYYLLFMGIRKDGCIFCHQGQFS